MIATYVGELFHQVWEPATLLRPLSRPYADAPEETRNFPEPPSAPPEAPVVDDAIQRRAARRHATPFVLGSVAACVAIVAFAGIRVLRTGADGHASVPTPTVPVSRSVVEVSQVKPPSGRNASSELARANTSHEEASDVAREESHVEQMSAARRAGRQRVSPVSDFGCADPSCP